MRHRHSRLRLRQKPANSWSIQRNLITAAVIYETIRTTKKRAEVVQPLVEKLITIAKTKEPRLAIREINRYVNHENASRKLMEVLKGRYAKRASGYTRIIPAGLRQGDGAKLVDFELVDRDTSAAKPEETAAAETKKPAAKKSAPKKSASSTTQQ